ncbi:hypothetical protein FHR83_001286 [Actinoplanes campanulatus]|uniref:Uncharacterized protein n=1 Tax=Actinoplanes campanulatus TaxID=113559 RepID=A0A7W5ACP1_9ACTN|nr:hypothetical protein [Actinoplanes campanulatus]MBB3093637.1 hypothetical protein [Actinoplanes campanulatus]
MTVTVTVRAAIRVRGGRGVASGDAWGERRHMRMVAVSRAGPATDLRPAGAAQA